MTIEYLKANEIRLALSRMFLAFPGSTACKNPGERMAVYVEALHRIPFSFVEEACTYAIRGKLGPGNFPPPAADLYRLAEELRARAFQANKCKVYDYPVSYSKEQRTRVIQGFRDLLSELRTGTPIDPDTATVRVFRHE